MIYEIMKKEHLDEVEILQQEWFSNGISYIEINDLFVSKNHRSHGIGKELIHICEKEACKYGIKHILLSSATKDAEAVRKFYTNNDYTIWTTVFYKTLDEH